MALERIFLGLLLAVLVVAFFLAWLGLTTAGFFGIWLLDKISFKAWGLKKDAETTTEKTKKESQTDIPTFDEVKCAECGNRMSCNPSGACWCKELPAVGLVDEIGGCLCRSCLEEKIRNGQSTLIR